MENSVSGKLAVHGNGRREDTGRRSWQGVQEAAKVEGGKKRTPEEDRIKTGELTGLRKNAN